MTPSDDNDNAAPGLTPLATRYELIRRVDAGLMGVVIEAIDRDTNRPVAITRLTHMAPADPGQFRRIFEALCRLDHPHLADGIAYLEIDGVHYLVDQFIDGRDLLSYLDRRATPDELAELDRRESRAGEDITDTDELPHTGPTDIDPAFVQRADASDAGPEAARPSDPAADPDPDTAAAADIVERIAADQDTTDERDLDLVLLRLERVLPQLLAGLEHLHRFRTPHGDLKPSNILVDDDGRCLLVDYGRLAALEPQSGPANATTLAAQAGLAPADDPSAVGQTAIEVGPPADALLAATLAYRAPESRELSDASPEADLYALGCVLFEAISGQRPFEGTPDTTDDHRRPDQPRALSDIEPQCPASWADIIHGLLDPSAGERPSLDAVRAVVADAESYAVDIPPSAVAAQERFLGRSELVDTVLDHAKSCYRRNRLGVSILCGPAGIGKSTVARAVSYLAARRGWLVLDGACLPRESLVYQGWDNIAAQLARLLVELPDELRPKLDACRRQAGALFPVLRRPQDPPADQLGRLDAIAGLRSLCRRLSSQRPMLIMMDDLHWASRDSFDLLLDLIGEPDGLRCMILGTWLADDAGADRRPTDAFATSPAPIHWVEVDGFSTAEAREYVISAGPKRPLEVQRAILENGGANPLLLEKLTDAADRADRPESVVGPTFADAPTVAERLDAVVDARLEQLDARRRFIVDVLAVAAIPLPASIISACADAEFHGAVSEQQNLGTALTQLLDAGFIRSVDSPHWSLCYAIAHNSYRRHIIDALRDQRSAHLAKRVADGLQQGWPAAQELRFEYLLRAGEDREAAKSALATASAAASRFAYNRAAKLWRWLSNNASFASLTTTANPAVEHARMERLAHRFADAARLFAEVADLVDDPIEVAKYRRAEFGACMASGQHHRAVDALTAGLAVFGEHYRPQGIVARVGAVKNQTLAATRRLVGGAEPTQKDAASPAEASRAALYGAALDVDDLLDVDEVHALGARLSMLAQSCQDARLTGLDRLHRARRESRLHGGGHHTRVTGWLDEAAALFERCSLADLQGRTEIVRADHCRRRGDFDAAKRHLSGAAQHLRRAQSGRDRQRHRIKLSWIALLYRRATLDQAELVARQLVHTHRRDKHVIFRGYQVLLPLYLLRRQTNLAEHLLSQCRAFVADAPINVAKIWVERMAARLNIARGRPEVAVGQLDVLAEQLHDRRLRGGPAAAALHLAQGQALAALAYREQSLVEHRHTDSLDRLKQCLAAVDSRRAHLSRPRRAQAYRLKARIALLHDQPKKALNRLDDAVEQLIDYDNIIERAKCLEARAIVLKALDTDHAADLLDQALAAYDYAGATLPLFMEGWPVPARFSQLERDAI